MSSLGFYYYFDQYYYLLVIPALLISFAAQLAVKGTYRRMSAVTCSRGITGAQAAYNVLRYYGITNVRIEQVGGKLSDHYDPRDNVIRLSPGVFGSNSVAAVGIACHEAGHAAQHAQAYKPIKVRNALVPVANIGSSTGMLIAIIGLMMGFRPIVLIGIILFSFVVLFQLATLPVEFNASRRALSVIDETNMLDTDERNKARKVLSAAAMTYVAATLVSIANLLRLILRFSNRRR